MDTTENSFRDTISTVDKKGKRAWIFPKKPKGKFYNARTIVSIFQLLIMFGLPFVKVNGEPLLLLNIVERKFILFGVKFWTQDFYLVVLIFITSVVFIILFTVVFGRLFCGWVCPQTIFMEMVFRKIEYWIEGDYTKQKKLNNQEWDTEKVIKKSVKHLIFFALSVLVANTLLAYVIGVDELWKIITEPVSQHVKGFVAMLLFSGLFYWIFSWFREQVCLIACPYGRLQGVMLDVNSIVVAYDYKRGEPRGKIDRRKETRTEGDCIDCKQCVHVCPTGIDIRNGTQLECINCTACMDACDSIMEKVDLPKGLIKYSSELNISKNKKLKFTPRIKAYSVLLLSLLILLGVMIGTRSDITTTLTKASGSLYSMTDNGHVRNIYEIQLINKTQFEYPVELKVISPEGGTIIVAGKKVLLKKEERMVQTIIIEIPQEKLTGYSTSVKVGVYHQGKLLSTETCRFLGP